MTPRLWLVRSLVLLTAVSGIGYIAWRWTSSVQWSVWWIAVPLVLAETYSLVDSLLFGLTVWRWRSRPEPPPAPAGLSVDVFVTTYNEPVELLRATASAVLEISYPHTTWILDDGNRPEVKELADSMGIGWLTRSDDWAGRNRHAKAGNLNNALMATHGEFVLVLDADQIPRPDILDRTLGYFTDEKVALVQTRQLFSNVPDTDPLGSQAPLFYGPIQQGKDGWNAAFFCGSNGILRREALMRLGVSRYAADVERRVLTALRSADSVIRKARRRLGPGQQHLDVALEAVRVAVRDARGALRRGIVLADVTHRFQQDVAEAARELVRHDTRRMHYDLAVLAERLPTLDEPALDRLARRDFSPLNAIESVAEIISAIDVDREDEAQPIMPMSVISVTEDLATCMRLHAAGWRSVYHDEDLAFGLAPEDLGASLTQRLRWAQGTMQVMLRENPWRLRGLSLAQRLMYSATMWSYLAGFAALAYLAAPMLFLGFGVLPVQALSSDFFMRLVPFLVANQLLFLVVGRGRKPWRGQQYSLALFPIWIRAVTTAVGNVAFGRSLGFAVTPKTRQDVHRPRWGLVRLQLATAALLIGASGVGITRWVDGSAAGLPTAVNLVWVAFDLSLLAVVVPAVRYAGYRPGPAARTPSSPATRRPTTTPIPAPRPAPSTDGLVSAGEHRSTTDPRTDPTTGTTTARQETDR